MHSSLRLDKQRLFLPVLSPEETEIPEAVTAARGSPSCSCGLRMTLGRQLEVSSLTHFMDQHMGPGGSAGHRLSAVWDELAAVGCKTPDWLLSFGEKADFHGAFWDFGVSSSGSFTGRSQCGAGAAERAWGSEPEEALPHPPRARRRSPAQGGCWHVGFSLWGIPPVSRASVSKTSCFELLGHLPPKVPEDASMFLCPQLLIVQQGRELVLLRGCADSTVGWCILGGKPDKIQCCLR